MSRSKLSNNELKFYNTAGSDDVIYAKIKGSSTDTLILEGASSATKVTLSNVADPTGTGQAATYDYVNTKVNELSNGLSWKAPAKLKTTANVAGALVGAVFTCTANAQQTFDSVLVALDDRVLITHQTDQIQNGLYTCSTQGNARAGLEEQAVFTRATDADTSAELKACAVFVEQGTVHADTAYVQTTDSPVLGTSNITFAQFSSPGEILAGTGLSKSGNTISANVDDSTIEIEAGSLILKDLGVTAGKVATNSLTGAQIQDASLTDAELADNACIERCIASSAVIGRCISNSAVTSNKILDGACVADKIATDAVTTVKVLDANITTSKLADSACTSDKIGSNQVLSSHYAAGSVDSTALGTAAVQTANCQDAFCTTAKLASQAVTSSKISPSNILTSHIAANQVVSNLIASAQIQASHMKADAITTNSILDGACTADKLAANSVTTSKIGTLSGLTVNGIVNATSFVATSGSGESDSGFSLPKCKSVSIDFDTDQAITGDDAHVTIGSDSALSAVTFAADDNITLCLGESVFRVKHLGGGTQCEILFEIAYYNGAGVQQAYSDVTSQTDDFHFSSASESTYLLSHGATLGDGATRIASIRLRIKHDTPSNTLAITDSLQTTCIAIDNTSSNVQRTFSSGTIS